MDRVRRITYTVLPGGRLSSGDAAAYLGMSADTLRKRRSLGTGPPFLKLKNGSIFYLKTDLDAYIAVAVDTKTVKATRTKTGSDNTL